MLTSPLDEKSKFNFNSSQRSFFDTLMDAKDDETRHSRAYFISAAGGTVNTYLLNIPLDTVRSNWGHEGEYDNDEPYIGLATSSTGIVKSLLKLGHTFHSAVKAPCKYWFAT
jgi:hypothetical protein